MSLVFCRVFFVKLSTCETSATRKGLAPWLAGAEFNDSSAWSIAAARFASPSETVFISNFVREVIRHGSSVSRAVRFDWLDLGVTKNYREPNRLNRGDRLLGAAMGRQMLGIVGVVPVCEANEPVD